MFFFSLLIPLVYYTNRLNWEFKLFWINKEKKRKKTCLESRKLSLTFKKRPDGLIAGIILGDYRFRFFSLFGRAGFSGWKCGIFLDLMVAIQYSIGLKICKFMGSQVQISTRFITSK